MKLFSLNGLWSGKCIDKMGDFLFEGTVPGSSINDLISCGKLPKNIFWRDNCGLVENYEECDYIYSKDFDFIPLKDEKYLLKFQRLDTYCNITLNGKNIASTQNGFISYSFDITEHLLEGKNNLSIYFTSPITAVKDMPLYHGAFSKERMNTRRTQCTYGWDWVARFVSCGICGNVDILSYTQSEIRIADTYVYTRYIDSDSAEINIDLNFEKDSACGIINLAVLSPEGERVAHCERYCNEEFVRINLDIPKAELWYPLGYGEQPIYKLIITDQNGNQLCKENFGIRTVKVMQLIDKTGSEDYKKCQIIKNEKHDSNEEFSGFILKVNGKKIMCMGGNWVPTEPFYTNATDKKVTELLELSAKAGVNMLRVWGGGAFESEHFYDECSRLGIMVTQDFLMACGTYPEETDWFIKELNKETEYATKLIRNKACLVWWTGDNENAVLGSPTEEDYMGRRSAFQGIAPILYKYDFNRPFYPSSPFGGNKYICKTVGTTHNTSYLRVIFDYVFQSNFEDYCEYWKKLRARFIAEEPQFGAVSKSTLLKIMTREDIADQDEVMWEYHTKNNKGLKNSIWETTVVFAKKLLGEFTSPDDKFFKLRYMQYEWVRLSMEQLRREMWFSSGIIFWMMNDCWPASSGWALVDFYNKPKDAYYAFKRCSKDILLSFDYSDNKYILFASNLREAVNSAALTIKIVNGDKVKELKNVKISLPNETTVKVAEFDLKLSKDQVLVAEIKTENQTDRTFYRHGNLEMVETSVSLTVDKENCTITVSSESYVHAVELEGDAVFEDNCFSLLPGETKTINYYPYGDSEIEVTSYTF